VATRTEAFRLAYQIHAEMEAHVSDREIITFAIVLKISLEETAKTVDIIHNI
jgi:hypothetical protein